MFARRKPDGEFHRPSAQGNLADARQPEAADLHSQLEDLFDEVWRAEADWRFNDRLDLSVGVPGS